MTIVAVIFGTMGLVAVLGLVTAVPAGWALMLLLGVLHAQVSASIPAIGFAAAYPIALFLTWFVAWVHPGTGDSSSS